MTHPFCLLALNELGKEGLAKVRPLFFYKANLPPSFLINVVWFSLEICADLIQGVQSNRIYPFKTLKNIFS